MTDLKVWLIHTYIKPSVNKSEFAMLPLSIQYHAYQIRNRVIHNMNVTIEELKSVH